MTSWPDFRGQEYSRRRLHQTSLSPRDTAGDQALVLGGSDPPWIYRVAWRTLTATHAAAVLTAYTQGGSDHGLYFLEWRLLSETNLQIGVGTGSGDLTLDLQCQLKDSDATAAGLTVTKNGVPVAYAAQNNSSTYFLQHQVVIAAANNVSGHIYRASWTYARRRRHVWAQVFSGPFPRENTGFWAVSAELVET